MPSSNWIRVVIGLFAAIVFLVSSISGHPVSGSDYRWVSEALSILTITLLLFDKWLWRLPGIRWLIGKFGHPYIYGTWKGELKFDKDANGKPGSIPIYVSIYQTFSIVSIRTFVSTSESQSLSANLLESKTARQLNYSYASVAPYGTRKSNTPHDGSARLSIIGFPVSRLEGTYYTSRGGSGEIILTEYTPSMSESYSQAVMRKYKKLS